MKKFIAGLVAAFMLSAGFVAVSAETASATCKPSQYTECHAVKVSAKGSTTKLKAGKKPKVVVLVKTQGGKPQGLVTVTIKGKGTTISKSVKVRNGKVTYVGKPLKPGKYKVTVAFKGATGFNDAKVTYTLKVTKKKKHKR